VTEAVRIVREQTIPALRAMWRDWYPVHVAALEAVLAALEQAQRERYEALSVTSKEGLLASEWVARTGRAEAEVARLRAQWDAGVLAGIRATAEQQGQIVALTGEVERLRLDLEIAEPKKSAAVMALAARAERAGAALKATQDMLREEEEQRRLARIAAEAERDALRAEVERLRADLAAWPGKWNATLDREARWIEKLMQAEAERDELRSEVWRLQSKLFAAEAERDALRVRSHAAPLPTSQPARAIEVCKRAATAPAAQPLDARAHAGDGESAQRELATAPAEGFFARGDDGHYHPDPAPAEEEKLKFWGASRPCETAEEPSCPHGHPPGSARDCACREKL
jgi:hypothetical protein